MSVELPDPRTPAKRQTRLYAAIGAAALLLTGAAFGVHFSMARSPSAPVSDMLRCEQPAMLTPDFASLGVESSEIFATRDYLDYSREVLAGAIRIPTMSYDDMSFDVQKEPRFRVFKKLHRYFEKQFPLLFAHAETVNTYGLLYTIKGQDESLKPVVLMAHQDVVPVPEETLDQWEYDPFEAFFDGEWLHGRGTCDTKNTLLAMHEAVEALLKQGWQPKRTLIMSLGFDEEIQGFRGARKLAEVIEERYGPDSIEMVIDEGLGVEEIYGRYFALPAVAEKGRLNFRFTLKTPGGHSSAPPDHTGIGIMADFVTQLEADVPLPPSLGELDVVKGMHACYGAHAAKGEIDSDLRQLYTSLGSPAVASELAARLGSERSSRVLVETTQAIDIIHGGVKINALPEEVVMEVNYRIKPDSSVDAERARVLDRVKQLAHQFSLGANLTNSFSAADAAPEVLVSPPKAPLGFMVADIIDILEVAPVSPFYNDTHWDLVSGTAKHVLEYAAPGFDADLSVVSAPALMTGNTDTAHYWNLTHNLYRFIMSLNKDMRNIHTVNEAIRPRSHVSAVVFFYEFLLNADEKL